MTANPNRKALLARWQKLTERERRMLGVGAAAVLFLVLAWAVLEPAWRVWRTGDAQRQQLQAQLQTLQRLAQETHALRVMPQTDTSQASSWLESSVKKWPANAQAQTQKTDPNPGGSDTVLTVTFKALPASTLVGWLQEAKTRHQMSPTQAQWRISTHANASTSANAAQAKASEPKWEGSVQFSIASNKTP